MPALDRHFIVAESQVIPAARAGMAAFLAGRLRRLGGSPQVTRGGDLANDFMH